MWVSFFAALAGLAVGHKGWAHMKEEWLDVPDTLTGYTFVWRSLPIVMILASIGVTTVLGSYLVKCSSRERNPCAAAANWKNCAHTQREDESGLLMPSDNEESKQSESLPLVALDDSKIGEDGGTGVHDVQAGRPDLATLIRTAAAEAATMAQQQDHARLVVAACGPAELVKATQNAVRSVRKEGSCVRLCFSGTDSRW